MLIGTLHKKLPELLGITTLTGGVLCRIKLGNGDIDEFRIASYWVAQMRYFTFFSSIIQPMKIDGQFESVTLVTIKTTNSEYRGLLLIPPKIKEYGSSLSLYPLKLPNWNDPVAEALQTLNVYPEIGVVSRGTTSYSFALEFWAGPASSGTLNMEGPSYGSAKLLDALLKVIYDFAKLYHDNEIYEYINLQKLDNLFKNWKDNSESQ